MGKLIFVANRLPVDISKRQDEYHFKPSVGGLATGLSSLPDSEQKLWLGWPGFTSQRNGHNRDKLLNLLREQHYHPVFLSKNDMQNYYYGFSNRTVWPLFHYFPERTIYEVRFWESYKRVNHKFLHELEQVVSPGDTVWIHDYHLMLLPKLLREKIPGAKIGFFLHIPFPSFELFRLLPWRHEILEGLLGADLIGFHTYDYARHFLSAATRIIGLEHNLGKLGVDNRIVKVDAFPMGINYEKYASAPKLKEVQQEMKRIQKELGDRKLILSIDRLDYTKGIIHRLEAFDLFLSENPEHKEKVTLVLVAVPSRTGVDDYIELRNDLEHLVGRVNGEHGSLGYTPVWYLYRSLPFDKLTALYALADVGLITPLRDGMNLISKEFLAVKNNDKGVLILSEMAGAASELGEALVVNSNNKAALVEAIKESLEMSDKEQIRRNKAMQLRLKRYTVTRWAHEFCHALDDITKAQKDMAVRKINKTITDKITKDFGKAKKRLFLLDYDGTLAGFKNKPGDAKPDAELLKLLDSLTENELNTVVIISGRHRENLEEWLGGLPLVLIAEHGAWIRERKSDWYCLEPLNEEWKESIRPILELFADRTPGAMVEEKDFSLVWHCRRSNPEMANIRMQELKDHVMNLTANLDVGVFEGNKILEIRHIGINKGRAAQIWLESKKWDFVLAAGDDYTDEEMFAVMPDEVYSIRVGSHISRAKFSINSVNGFRKLLKQIAET